MAYGVKYLFKWQSLNGTVREIRVLLDGYDDEVIQRPLGRAPVLHKEQNGAVFGTSLEFYAECNVDGEFAEFYTSDPKAYRVDLYAGNTLLWQGYISPELYSEPDIAPPYDVQVVATDGLGELKLYLYAAQGLVTLRALLTGLLAHTGLGTDVYLVSSLKAGSRGAGALLDMAVNLDFMEGQSCYDVLTFLLDTLHATITWWGGAWLLVRETNVTMTSGKVRYFNTSGNSALLAGSSQVLGAAYSAPVWPVGSLTTVVDPAKNRVTVQAPWHVATALLNAGMSSDTAWTKGLGAFYITGYSAYQLAAFPTNNNLEWLKQSVAMAGLTVPMSVTLRVSAWANPFGTPVVGVLLVYTTASKTYILRRGSEGSPEWKESDPISGIVSGIPRKLVDYVQTLAAVATNETDSEYFSLTDIPALSVSGAFPAGTLDLYIVGRDCYVFSASLDVELPAGYQDIIEIDNGARGAAPEVEVGFGRQTSAVAVYKAFLQGLLLDGTTLITGFTDANFTSSLYFLAFIARDYALSVALPRIVCRGNVSLETSVSLPPLVLTKGALDYWLETWSWNLYDDELEILARTLPAASLTVDSETIMESDAGSGTAQGGTSGPGGGSSPGGGGGSYLELSEALDNLVQLREAYDYMGVAKGLYFEGSDIIDDQDQPIPDVEVVTVDGERVLHSRLPIYSDSFISAGGLSDSEQPAGLDWAALAAATNEQINISHLTTALGPYVKIIRVNGVDYYPTYGRVELPAGGGSTAWSDITGKPTTLAGYGITDALTASQIATAYLQQTDAALLYLALAGGAITGSLTVAGSLGVGNASPTYKLDVSGVIHTTQGVLSDGFVTAGSASDARLKEDIRPLDPAVASRIVLGARPVAFRWTEQAGELCPYYRGDDLGMIAQEVEPLLPSAVSSIFFKYKRLDYTKFIAPVITVVQDHEDRLRKLEEHYGLEH